MAGGRAPEDDVGGKRTREEGRRRSEGVWLIA